MLKTIEMTTNGEKFYDITREIQRVIAESCSQKASGLVFIITPHTSCGLTINESYDSSAKSDLESFLKLVAPRNATFIEHTSEGEDDSPSHMKSMLTSQNITLPIEDGQCLIGIWQGIYLCEFRDAPKTRKVHLKIIID